MELGPKTYKEAFMESTNLYIVWAYGFYVLISVLLTMWVARTLSRNGLVFLVEAFNNNRELAGSVNHLLVVGFYLINIGYVTLALKYGDKPSNLQQSIEFLSTKVGLVLLVLGGMHFINLRVFSNMRKRAQLKNNVRPPVPPQQWVPPVPPQGFTPPPATQPAR
jgi:hypothetical protein